MSVSYQAVGWNAFKKRYDLILVAAIGLLHFILLIGPMARLDKRWVPLLYNRRHLGVSMFLLGLIHAVLAIVTYHVGGTRIRLSRFSRWMPG